MLNGTGSVPVANAGPDLAVTEATPPIDLVLDGTGSTDVDGTITTYLWTASDGSGLTNRPTAQAGFHAADDAAFTATLEVCDDDGLCDTDTAQVTVSNAAPTLTFVVGSPTVEQGVPVEITATYADAGSLDSHTATVDWGPGGALPVLALGGTITATNTYAGTGPRTIEVCVTDDDGATASRRTTSPSSASSPATTPRPRTRTWPSTSTCSPTTRRRGQLTIQSVTAPTHGTTAIAGGLVRYTPAANFCGTDTFSYTAAAGVRTDTGDVTVTITCVPDAPVADAGSDRFIQEGTPQTIFGSATDPDGDTLAVAWSPAAGLDDATVLQPTALAADDASTTYTLTVCDTGLLCDDDTAEVTITNATPNVATTPVPTQPGVAVSPTVTFTDRGALDTHTATVLWPGDPAAADLGPVTSPLTLPERTFAAPGTYVGQVCVTDDDGAIACANQFVHVRFDAPPDAVDDTFAIERDSEANVLAVLANDSDADADPITIVDHTAPSAGGSVACDPSSCTYTPLAGFEGAGDVHLHHHGRRQQHGHGDGDGGRRVRRVADRQPHARPDDGRRAARRDGDDRWHRP